MFAVVVIPDFSLQARLRSDPSAWSRPIALLTEAHSRKDPKDRTKFRITQLTEPARKAGVATGMSPPQAQARCPDLELCTPSPPREQAAQEALLQWAATTSPSIEATADGICTLS